MRAIILAASWAAMMASAAALMTAVVALTGIGSGSMSAKLVRPLRMHA